MGVLHGAPAEFEAVEDVPSGGVLLAPPALLQNGLLADSRRLFSMPEGSRWKASFCCSPSWPLDGSPRWKPCDTRPGE